MIIRKQAKHNSNQLTYFLHMFQPFLFPCKQIIETIQNCHRKTFTWVYNGPFAFA